MTDADVASWVCMALKWIGEDPTREGLKDTPERVVKACKELFSGYVYSDDRIAEMLTTFADDTCKEMVVLKDIEFNSFCEHHLLPFAGKAHVAYLPNGRVVGVSKLARIVDVFSKRLQIQERLTQQITKALQDHLKPLGVACVVEGVHSCMVCRGVRKSSATMITSSLLGEFLVPAVRAEFFSLIYS